MYRILIAEDDDIILNELQLLLNNQGYEAVCWNHKQMIKEQIQSEEPHLIL